MSAATYQIAKLPNYKFPLPFSRFDQLANFALDQVALERADVADVELAVEVVGFVLEGAGQQVVANLLEDLPRQILGSDRDHLGARHILTEIGDAETAFTLGVAAFLVNDFGINENQFRVRVLLESDVNDGDAARDADLRRGQAHAARSIHRLEHVLDQFLQSFIKDRDFLCRFFKDGISEFNDGIDHFSCNQ